MKSNQYEIKIPCNRIQDAYEKPENMELNIKNSDFVDEFQVITSDICTKCVGKNIRITVRVIK